MRGSSQKDTQWSKRRLSVHATAVAAPTRHKKSWKSSPFRGRELFKVVRLIFRHVRELNINCLISVNSVELKFCGFRCRFCVFLLWPSELFRASPKPPGRCLSTFQSSDSSPYVPIKWASEGICVSRFAFVYLSYQLCTLPASSTIVPLRNGTRCSESTINANQCIDCSKNAALRWLYTARISLNVISVLFN